MPASAREAAAHLYLEAFGGKIGGILGPAPRARAFLAEILDPAHAIAALQDGQLVGIAGYKTAQGGLMNGGLRALARHYGWLGALWRAPLLALLERRPKPGLLQMDGICVAASARGMGVGSALLSAIFALAEKAGHTGISLDVIDANPRARALYLRQGFVPMRTQHIGPLRHVLGFASSTTMIRAVEARAGDPGKAGFTSSS